MSYTKTLVEYLVLTFLCHLHVKLHNLTELSQMQCFVYEKCSWYRGG